MSKKKVKEVYPESDCIVGISGTGTNRKNTYTITVIGAELSHTCATPQSAWRSALNRIGGKVSRKKGDKTGRKAKMSIQLQPEHKTAIERKHGSVQKFLNEMVQDFLTK